MFFHSSLKSAFTIYHHLVIAAVSGLCIAQASVAQTIQAEAPPQIRPPMYQVVDLAHFEDMFGPSFTSEDVTPLVVGPRDPSGTYPLRRIDYGTGEIVLHESGTILPTSFESMPDLNVTARNMVDFFSTDPDLIGVDWSLSTRGQMVLAYVETSSNEVLRMQGVWLTLAVSSPSGSDAVTVFIPQAVEAGGGNEQLSSAPSENLQDYLHEVDCEGNNLGPGRCADLQQCFTEYATCMTNAATTYNNGIQECNLWWQLIKNAGAGAVGGGVGGAGIGSVIPVLGTAMGGAIGIVTGGFTGGLGGYWACVRGARLTYEDDKDICINNLEGCLEQWILDDSLD